MCQAQLNAKYVKYLIIFFTPSPPPQLEVDGAIVLIFTSADTEAPRVTAQGQLTESGGIRTQASAHCS